MNINTNCSKDVDDDEMNSHPPNEAFEISESDYDNMKQTHVCNSVFDNYTASRNNTIESQIANQQQHQQRHSEPVLSHMSFYSTIPNQQQPCNTVQGSGYQEHGEKNKYDNYNEQNVINNGNDDNNNIIVNDDGQQLQTQNNGDNIVEQYKHKIREQANRLQKQEIYIASLEKKISSIPSQIMVTNTPLSELDLINSGGVNSNNNHNNYNEANNLPLKDIPNLITTNPLYIQFCNNNNLPQTPLTPSTLSSFLSELTTLTSKNSKYQRDLLSSHEIIQKLKDKNSSSETVSKNILSKYNDLLSKYNLLSSSYNSSLLEKNSLQNNTHQLESKLNQYINEYNKLSQTNLQAIDERNNLLTQLHSTKTLLNTKNNEIDDLKSLLDQTIQQHKDETTEIMNTSYKMAESKYTAENHELQTQLDQLKSHTNELKNKNSELENELLKHQQKQHYFQEQLNSITNKKKITEDELYKSKQIHENEVNSLKRRNNELELENITLNNKINSIENELNTLKYETTSSQENHFYINEQLRNLKLQYEKISKEKLKIEIELNRVNVENKNLQSQIKFSQSKLDTNHEQLLNKIDTLRSQINDNESTIDDLRKDNDKLTKKNISLYNLTTSKLQSEKIFAIENKHHAQSILTYENKIKEITASNDALFKENKNLHMQINDLKSELSSIKNENAMLLNNKASHVNELQSLKLKYKDNQSEHNELIETISSYKTLYLNDTNCNYFSEAFSAFLVKPCLNISLFIEQVHNELMYLLDKLNTYETQSNSNASKNRAYELEVSELNIQLNNARSELSAIQSHLQKDKKLKSELTNKKNVHEETIRQLQNEKEALMSKLDSKDTLISHSVIKVDYLEEIISYYEMTKSFCEKIMMELSQYVENKNLKYLINEFVKASYDLINTGKELANRSYINEISTRNGNSNERYDTYTKETEIKQRVDDLFFVFDKINSELSIENKLLKNNNELLLSSS